MRVTSLAPGTHRSNMRILRLSGASGLGRHQIGVRWKTTRRSTSGAIAGITWIAEAPVPMIATRLPRRSTSWFQRAVCMVSPANVSWPSIAGGLGCEKTPVAPEDWPFG